MPLSCPSYFNNLGYLRTHLGVSEVGARPRSNKSLRTPNMTAACVRLIAGLLWSYRSGSLRHVVIAAVVTFAAVAIELDASSPSPPPSHLRTRSPSPPLLPSRVAAIRRRLRRVTVSAIAVAAIDISAVAAAVPSPTAVAIAAAVPAMDPPRRSPHLRRAMWGRRQHTHLQRAVPQPGRARRGALTGARAACAPKAMAGLPALRPLRLLHLCARSQLELRRASVLPARILTRRPMLGVPGKSGQPRPHKLGSSQLGVLAKLRTASAA